MSKRGSLPSEREHNVRIHEARAKVGKTEAAIKRLRKQLAQEQADLAAAIEAKRVAVTCPHPEKRVYENQGEATRAAVRAAESLSSMRAYKCQCGKWHLTHLSRWHAPKPSTLTVPAHPMGRTA